MKYVKCKYSLAEDCHIQTIVQGFCIEGEFYKLDRDGVLHLIKGFWWDGATGAIDTKNFVIPSAVHDAFCTMINKGQLPEHFQALVDEQLRIMEKDQKMTKIRRLWTYFVVRLYQIEYPNRVDTKIFEVKSKFEVKHDRSKTRC